METKEQSVNQRICDICGALINEEDSYSVDDTILCRDCYERDTVICACCGDRILCENDRGDGDISLCSDCRDEHYCVCNECGALVYEYDSICDEGDGEVYCQICYERRHRKDIHHYGYKPDPIFFGHETLYYGVELEIDKGGENNDSANDLAEIANQNGERIYCKHDGSLDDGFEIVSHPMTLDYHRNVMPWEELMREAVSMGYRSHQTATCGLHIHVNRNAFGDTYSEQENTISRIVFFIESHWNEMVRFSRRKEEQLQRWSSRYGISENAKITYEKVKNGNYGRYVAVNLTNDNTVEFRMFRGTLRYATFIATLQLVDEICRHAIAESDKKTEDMTWGEFVSSVDADTKPELIAYLKSKQLYVNDLIEEEVEL